MPEAKASKFYVFWEMGSCMYGDHKTGQEACDTHAAAMEFVEWLRKEDKDVSVWIVDGKLVEFLKENRIETKHRKADQ